MQGKKHKSDRVMGDLDVRADGDSDKEFQAQAAEGKPEGSAGNSEGDLDVEDVDVQDLQSVLKRKSRGSLSSRKANLDLSARADRNKAINQLYDQITKSYLSDMNKSFHIIFKNQGSLFLPVLVTSSRLLLSLRH